MFGYLLLGNMFHEITGKLWELFVNKNFFTGFGSQIKIQIKSVGKIRCFFGIQIIRKCFYFNFY